MNVAFTAARGLTLESLLKAIEQKLPDHFVPDGRLEGGLSILRVNRLGKVSMVLPTAAAASGSNSIPDQYFFKRVTFRVRLGKMEVMPSAVYFNEDGISYAQLRFPSSVYDRITGAGERPFDATTKGRMLSMICQLASAISVDGFALSFVDEDQVHPAPDLQTIARFVGDPQTWLKDPTRFILAGCKETLLDGPFASDPDEPPFFYTYGEYAIFDSLWPALANSDIREP